MSDLKITIDEIKELMDKMMKTGLGKVAIEEDDFKLTLCAKKEFPHYYGGNAEDGGAMPISGADGSAAVYSVGREKPDHAELDGNGITAPIVGTYYNAPSPDKDPFVKVGQAVKKGDVLFIIESMKLMNEIQSEFDGEVTDILVKGGSPVEFGQTIMVIK